MQIMMYKKFVWVGHYAVVIISVVYYLVVKMYLLSSLLWDQIGGISTYSRTTLCSFINLYQ